MNDQEIEETRRIALAAIDDLRAAVASCASETDSYIVWDRLQTARVKVNALSRCYPDRTLPRIKELWA